MQCWLVFGHLGTDLCQICMIVVTTKLSSNDWSSYMVTGVQEITNFVCCLAKFSVHRINGWNMLIKQISQACYFTRLLPKRVYMSLWLFFPPPNKKQNKTEKSLTFKYLWTHFFQTCYEFSNSHVRSWEHGMMKASVIIFLQGSQSRWKCGAGHIGLINPIPIIMIITSNIDHPSL